MVQHTKIEEVTNRSKFDTIVKFNTRTIIKDGRMNLAEIRTKGRTCYFYVIEKCSRERAAKLVRSFVNRTNGECTTSATEADYLLVA